VQPASRCAKRPMVLLCAQAGPSAYSDLGRRLASFWNGLADARGRPRRIRGQEQGGRGTSFESRGSRADRKPDAKQPPDAPKQPGGRRLPLTEFDPTERWGPKVELDTSVTHRGGPETTDAQQSNRNGRH
jgi:hypothetical protein